MVYKLYILYIIVYYTDKTTARFTIIESYKQ